MSKRILFLLLTVLACSLFVVGCGGSDGSNGTNGTDGATVGDITTSDEFQQALDEAVAAANATSEVAMPCKYS